MIQKQFFVGLIIGLLLLVGLYVYMTRKHKAEIEGYHSLIQQSRDSTTYLHNQQGELISRNILAQTTIKALQDVRPAELAKIQKDFNVKLKDITSYLTARVQIIDSGESKIIRDTIRIEGEPQTPAFAIHDNYLKLVGHIYPETISWDYSYTDTISFLGRTKKKWFLGKETYYVDGKFQNKKAKITSLIGVEIKNFKDKRFSIGPAVLYDPLSNSVRVGVSFQYALIKF